MSRFQFLKHDRVLNTCDTLKICNADSAKYAKLFRENIPTYLATPLIYAWYIHPADKFNTGRETWIIRSTHNMNTIDPVLMRRLKRARYKSIAN